MTKLDKEIQEGLYDPRGKNMKYINFVKQHKAWRVPGSNALDFKRIGAAWQQYKREHGIRTAPKVDKVEVFRRLKEQRLRKAKHPARRYDPKSKTPLSTEIRASIKDEQKAIDDYGKIITHAKKVRPAIVKDLEEIRNDEKNHKAKFLRMMKK